ncbi:16S rRNA (guanine(527)-N(7))-methyltransferase RsmG [uncultured Roseivirga sp.]|uniref:16S rRNA (guanine(527)-N(7))-methyltransferase RsmG n=2 Tax=Roseivirga TaxID=290180 RepID=UPI0032B1132A
MELVNVYSIYLCSMKNLLQYFPNLNQEQKERFERLPGLYAEWNDKINVVSRKDIENLMERHVIHSLGIAKVLNFRPGTRILDVGTGGGFPGIPLAILFPECQFLLVDSIGKKIKVVNEVAHALGLENVKGQHVRAEQVEGQFHFIVSRAVTRLGNFYPWVKDKFMKQSNHSLKNGILYLKGGELDEELKESKLKRIKTYALSEHFKEEFFETKKVVYIPAQ